ncbi:hypothetical protein CI610_03367 [invertebrate metagenome]|uniref:Uncharacterized protein n=1 Tax=invertebrate metagenome TaxID=1711999 RepID=A0A2H9T396_9ZZZZ
MLKLITEWSLHIGGVTLTFLTILSLLEKITSIEVEESGVILVGSFT